jgi:septation ring formation regulator EzrA
MTAALASRQHYTGIFLYSFRTHAVDMPLKKYKKRRWEIYFPSEEFLERWKQQARTAKMPLSKWIFETVESRLAEATINVGEIAKDQEALRDQNRALRKELENARAELERQKTEMFKLKHEALLQPVPCGFIQLSEKIVDALKGGGTWSSRELLKELDVSPNDIEAIQITTRQLQTLQDFGLIQEGARGWRWVG